MSATGPEPWRAATVPEDSASGEHDVFARPEGHVLRLIRAEDEIGERGPVFGGKRRGQNPAVDPERDLASRDGLELRREDIIEQEAHAQRAQNVRIGQSRPQSAP